MGHRYAIYLWPLEVKMEGIKKYYKHMYKMRFFIANLVSIGLKSKFKRSKLGVLWTFISPLCLTIIMAVVFSVVFHYDYRSYLPYILSGILFWDLFTQSFNGGSSTIMGFDSFIRQCNHPITLYTLTNSLLYTTSFLISLISLIIIILFTKPTNLIIALVSLPITIIIFAIFSWCGTTISSYIGVQYRDYPMGVALLLQMIWYVSPVFFDESMFESNPIIYAWFRINPITHMLNLIRCPFLDGKFPLPLDYVYSIGFVLVLAIIAFHVNKKKEKNAIFYL